MTPSSRPSQPPADRATSSKKSPHTSRAASPSGPGLPNELENESAPTARVAGTQSPRSNALDDLEAPSDSASRSGPPLPLQQRRRVTRACDECRRKKIKCDGKQPCTHCQVYSYGSLLFPCPFSSSLHRSPTPQNVPTTSLPTGGETRRRSTLKRSRISYREPRPCFASSCPMLISMIPTWILLSSRNSGCASRPDRRPLRPKGGTSPNRALQRASCSP